ncbi:hypothetical protein FA13DRAFT_1814654 [Coprinellus micaceus]|uniref:Bromodomain associated domain-containing protein n=1 Tax=Coprinellus micaceus TaxID=71717 RepID=A0A4Y7T8M9_COPMI|nr:hypothetical protein FA13DRAFT_1814654 [Coprinellus micaceus]
MEACAQKLLESTTHKTLHAHAFSRASTQATFVLTDLLSRYLALLSSTCAKYAQHAGRRNLTIHDAIEALDELGASLEDLNEYGSGEGKELNRYALHSARRQEELNEFRSQLVEGLRQDRDDSIPLEYARYDEQEDYASEDEEGEDEGGVNGVDEDTMDVDSPLKRRPGSPPLVLSPISSNIPPSPSRKRPRTSNWSAPEYSLQHPLPSPESVQTSPNLTQPIDLPAEKPIVEVPKTLTTTTSTSDILVQVPYSQSTLSSLPERHLPGPLPPQPPSASSSSTSIRALSKHPIPQIEPSFIGAYHYILTHPPPPTPPPSTLQRHRVAMSLLGLIQSNSRWTPADSMYGSTAPCSPRVATMPPSFPVAVSDLGLDGKPKDPTGEQQGSGDGGEAGALVGQPSSRLPDLARHTLHPAILSRSTRLTHPPVLHRGSKPLVYGHGVPAPWNSNPVPPPDANGVPQTPLTAKPKEKGENSEGGSKPAIPDAILFPTWDYDSKDYRVPLPRHRTRMGSLNVAGGSSSGTITLPHITRKSTKG